MKKITLALLFVSSSALAAGLPLDGMWKGSGTIVRNGEKLAPCNEVSYDIRQTADSLNIKEFFNCGGDAIETNGIGFEVNGTDLMFEGKKIGMIDETGFKHDRVQKVQMGEHRYASIAKLNNGVLSVHEFMQFVSSETGEKYTIYTQAELTK